MMPTIKKHKINLQNLSSIAGIVICLFAAIGFGQVIGEKTAKNKIESLEKELCFYTSLEEFDLKGLLLSIDSVNIGLTDIIRDNRLIIKYRHRNKVIADSNKILTFKLDSIYTIAHMLQKEKAMLHQNLSKLEKDFQRINAKTKDYTLSPGESACLVPNTLILGLTSITSSGVEFNVNNKKLTLDIGNSYECELPAGTGVITLREVNRNAKKDFVEIEFYLVG